jgi:type IV secretion system protein VirB1
VLELLLMCAPAVDPVTMAAVVKQESGGQPWVIHNNTSKKSVVFASKAAAVAAALTAIGRGDSVDLGLAQINSRNLPALGLTVDQVFDPCTNLAAGATILAESYHKAGSLNGALSLYNTGRPDSNIGAAYARRVFGQAGVQVPAIPGGKLAELPKAPSFDANPTAMKAVRLTITPSPFAAELSPERTTLRPASWR